MPKGACGLMPKGARGLMPKGARGLPPTGERVLPGHLAAAMPTACVAGSPRRVAFSPTSGNTWKAPRLRLPSRVSRMSSCIPGPVPSRTWPVYPFFEFVATSATKTPVRVQHDLVA